MRYVVIFISLLVTINLKAQENYSDNKLPVFKQVTHPFMPPITSAYFFFSEEGLIWFSTAQGLTSFDGSEVTYYSSLQQATGFELSRIFTMAEDRNHNFYLGTPVGLYYYDRKAGSFTTLPYSFSDNHKQSNIGFDALYCDNEGMIYAGSTLNGLFVYDPVHKKLHHYNMDASKPDSWSDRRLNTVSSFATHNTDNNKLWVGTFHGIYLFDKIKKTFEQRFEVINPAYYLPGPETPDRHPVHYDIQKMEVENDSIIWFNCWTAGFGKYNTHTGKVKLFLHDARLKTTERYIGYNITKFARLSQGKYLLGVYDDKTIIFDTRTEKATYFNITKNDFPEEQTRFVTNDRNGNVWLLQRGFLYAAVPEALRLQSVIVPNLTKVSFSKPIIRGIYFDSVSQLFYGAFSSSVGVHVFDSNFNKVSIIPTPVVNNYFTYNSTLNVGISKDGSGRFWTVGWENNMMRNGEKEFGPVGEKFPSLSWLGTQGEFNGISVTHDGNILLRKIGGIIYYINHLTLAVDTIRYPLFKGEEVEMREASRWYDNKRGLIYLTSSEGVAQYNLDKREMKTIPHSSLFGNFPSKQAICAPALDEGGRMWFMILKYGIRIIDPGTLSCTDSILFDTRGLMRGDYTAIIGGTGNYILLRSQNGIVVYDFVKQQSFLFDHSNGLSSPENQSFLFSNGYMIVGQNSRFEYFNLSNLDNYSSAVTPYLNTVNAETTAVFIRTGLGENKTIKLTHRQNTFIISFSTAEFIFPERIEYAYQLTPLDNDWHYTNYFNRRITFTKLPPGKYIFRLKAQMQGGNWTALPVEYVIIIKPAWWQTLVFKLLISLLLITGIIYFYRKRISLIRKKAVEKTQHEKELLELEAKALRAQMNPHFIFNCLNSIKSLIQQHEEEKSVTYLTIFSKLIRTLFNNADKKEISLYDEIETCKLYLQLEAMRFDTKFSYSVNIDDNTDLKSIQIPALIIQPFIENAIWHGIVPRNSGGHVSINVLRKDEVIEIIIDDDGIGREASQQNKSASGLAHQSKGVNLTQSRLELNNLLQQRQAKLETIDKKDESGSIAGTKVIITIKEEI
jgi:two-component sensor histidine kinase